jgi:hypothetical protein
MLSKTRTKLIITKQKKFVLLSILLGIIIAFLVLEVFGVLALKLKKIEMVATAQFYQKQSELFSEKSAFDRVQSIPGDLLPKQTPHPYFGYVMNRERDPRVNESGFISKLPSPRFKSMNKVNIGILGGSAASYFAEYLQNQGGRRAQQLVLAIWPELRGHQIEFHNLALPGGKQPQQFQIASYFAQFLDITINLEGFNEVTFAPPKLYPNNFPKHARWFYPKNYIKDLSNLRLGFSAWLLKSMSQAGSSGYFLPKSRFYFFIWQRVKAEFIMGLQNLQSEQIAKYGGDRIYEDQEIQEVLDSWAEWTKKQEVVLRSYGVKSFFFIQSNPYAGKKEMGDEESRLARPSFSGSELYKVRDRYAAIEKKSESLKKKICIHSLSSIFDNELRQIYVDPYSHVNELGNSLILEEIFSRIKACGNKFL